MFDIGSKVCFVRNPGFVMEVIKPKPHEHKKKGKRMDGVIVPMTFVLMPSILFPEGIRAWQPTEQLRAV
jgi:hypothetical protein